MDLRSYQKSVVDNPRSQALFWEMGLGKTRAVLESLPRQPAFHVVICPSLAGAGASVWTAEAAKWRHDIACFSTIGKSAVMRSRERTKALMQAESRPVILILNFEQAAETKNWLKLLNPVLHTIVCDESSFIKDNRADRTKACLKLRRCIEPVKNGTIPKGRKIWDYNGKRYCSYYEAIRAIVLTGTPIINNICDLYTQIKFVDHAILKESFVAYRARYAKMGGYLGKQVVGSQNLDELWERLRPVVSSFTKAQVAPELPPVIYVEREVELGGAERECYENIKRENILACVGMESIALTNALAKFSKQIQAVQGFFYMPDGKAQEIGKSKRQMAIELLAGELAAVPKTIVWTIFDYEQERLLAEIQNSVSDPIEFKESPRARVLVAKASSSGYALNLQLASTQIFLSNSFRYGDRVQAEARSHRLGITEPVTIIDIIAPGTLDRKILAVLHRKATLAQVAKEELGVNITDMKKE